MFYDLSESYNIIGITETDGKTHMTEGPQWMATNPKRTSIQQLL